MKRPMGLSVGFVLCLLLLPTIALAQGTAAAGVAGTVKDLSGAVLPGVTIEASSPALIEKVRSAVTDEKGDYQISELRPGTYSVTFTLPGFSTFKRDGLDLAPNFTATVNVELKVGGVEETVTVTGQTPLVDIRNTTQQKTISSTLLDTVPTAKSTFAFVALIPAAMAPTILQDVGGSNGEAATRVSVHGSKPNDAKFLMDGLSYHWSNTRGFYINPLAAQEVVLDTGGGGSAEFAFAGSVINMISKDGGDKFSATLFTSGMKGGMQSDNLTDELKAQGLTATSKSLRIYDLNGVFGGPLKRDKLWFTSAHRRVGQQHQSPWYRDANLEARVFGAPAAVWKFAPDLSKPVVPTEDQQTHNLRLTLQATSKDKVTLSYDWQWNKSQDNNGAFTQGTAAWEAAKVAPGSVYRCTSQRLYQATWTRPATNKLLFEAGANYVYGGVYGRGPCAWYENRIAIRDSGINLLHNGGGIAAMEWQYPINQRASVSYTTGAHTIKAGMLALETLNPGATVTDRLPFSYTFNNGVPTQITEFVSPVATKQALRLGLGLFAQDQWRIDRMTLNLGLRYEYVNARAPAVDRPASLLADAASFPEVDCIPCWHDIYPRMAVAYDLFGNGKTAVKASIGKYASQVTGFGNTFGPASAVVNSTTRAWTDTNGNFYPDCDLRNPLASGECAAMANQAFGQVQIRTNPDPNWITGWGKRAYAWEASASVDHELRPGMAVNVGYFRTWYGNFIVTDNLAVTPADFDPYCVPWPSDSRLPNSGQQVCGFYDIKPALFGQVNNLVTPASNYGSWTEYYQGVDFNLNIRLPRGGQLGGGWNVGNSITLPQGMSFVTNHQKKCFVVDSPQDMTFPTSIYLGATGFANGCETQNSYQNRLKLNASYPLPRGFQVAAVYQNLPGTYYSAFTTFTTAQIAPTLGRNLAGGTRTITVDLAPLYNHFLDGRITQLDLRLSKIVHVGRTRIQGNLDVFNVVNSSSVLGGQQQYGATWLQPTQILPGRMLKLGFQVDF